MSIHRERFRNYSQSKTTVSFSKPEMFLNLECTSDICYKFYYFCLSLDSFRLIYYNCYNLWRNLYFFRKRNIKKGFYPGWSYFKSTCPKEILRWQIPEDIKLEWVLKQNKTKISIRNPLLGTGERMREDFGLDQQCKKVSSEGRILQTNRR